MPSAEPIFLDRPHPATLEDEALLAVCRAVRKRTGGPGGQHRNKVETGVVLRHEPTGTEAHADERRSVVENQRMAVRRLRLVLAVLVRCPVPDGDQRSEVWRERCGTDGRIACNPDHRDYPSLLAEAMDNLWSCGLDPRKAAARLCSTASQVVKLLKEHPPALVRLNEARALVGEHPFH